MIDKTKVIAPARLIIYGYIIYFLISFASFLPYLFSDYCQIDELSLMAEARRVLTGEQPHRDFFTTRASGNLYLVAGVWRLLGNSSYLPIKLLTFSAIILAGILLLLITRQFTKRNWLSLIPSLIFINYLGHLFPFASDRWFGAVAAIIATYFIVRYLCNFSMSDLYCCGLASGLTLLFAVPTGLIVTITCLLMVLGILKLSLDKKARLLLIYLAGLATIILPLLIFYFATGSLGQYWRDIFIWPWQQHISATGLTEVHWADIGNFRFWRFSPTRFNKPIYILSSCALFILLLLPMLVLIFLGGLLSAGWNNQISDKENLFLRIFSLLAVGLYLIASFSQPDYPGLLWGSMPAIILTVYLFDCAWDRLLNSLLARRALGAMMLFFVMALVMVFIYKAGKIMRGDESELFHSSQTVRLSDRQIIDLINSRSSGQDSLFAYNYGELLYYLTNTRPATHNTLLANRCLTDGQMRNMMMELVTRRPKFIAFSSQVDLSWLAEFKSDFLPWLTDHYRLEAQPEGWILYQRKE